MEGLVVNCNIWQLIGPIVKETYLIKLKAPYWFEMEI